MLGRSETVSDVAVTEPELYRLLEPAVVPTQSSKFLAVLPGLHAKVTLVPVNVLPGAGVVSTAGVSMV